MVKCNKWECVQAFTCRGYVSVSSHYRPQLSLMPQGPHFPHLVFFPCSLLISQKRKLIKTRAQHTTKSKGKSSGWGNWILIHEMISRLLHRTWHNKHTCGLKVTLADFKSFCCLPCFYHGINGITTQPTINCHLLCLLAIILLDKQSVSHLVFLSSVFEAKLQRQKTVGCTVASVQTRLYNFF